MMTSKELKAYLEKHNLQGVFADEAAIRVHAAQFQEQTGEMPDAPEYRRFFRTVAGTTQPTSSGIIFDTETTLPNIALQAAAGKGVPVIVNHDTGGFLGGGKDIVPIGRTTGGEYNADEQQAYINFFIDDHPTMPEAAKVLAAIYDDRMPDVSIGGLGQFDCSLDGTRMGMFGCSEGHLPLMTVMIDKSGNETYDREQAVDTFTIHAVFKMSSLVELSMAWAGAIPGAEITEKYSEHQPHIESVYGDTQLFTFSDLSGAYFRKPETPTPKPIGGNPMATPNPDHAVQIQEMRDARDKVQTELDAATVKLTELQPKADGFDALQTQFNALKTKYTEAQGQLTEIETLKAQGEQYKVYATNLRQRLKDTKDGQIHVSEEDKKAFHDRVDTMTDVSVMEDMLSEMQAKKESNSDFLKRIGVITPSEEEVHNEAFLKAQRDRTMAGY
jgi:hypothetical protein